MVWKITFVVPWPRLARSFSISISNEISTHFSLAVISLLSVKPGGSACLYIHLSPFGQAQNQPYVLFSTLSRKYLQTFYKYKPSAINYAFFGVSHSIFTIWVWLLFFMLSSPCFWLTTSSSFCSSQFSMVSVPRVSSYTLRFSAFLSMDKSCENLHRSPFWQVPCLK